MKVGFLGIQCDNPNLGVAALGYSALRIAHDVAPQGSEFVLFSPDQADNLARVGRTLGFTKTRLRAAPIRHRSLSALRATLRELQSCDAVIDLTGGDSFSDIYGARRLMLKLFDKQLALLAGTALVLAPQTIGPFRSRALVRWVTHVLRHATLVFTRDEPSRDTVISLVKRKVTVSTDVAVRLPWRASTRASGDSPRIAFSVSGLLWAGGYTKNNQFGLRADYRGYCDLVVAGLLAAGYEVHLVAHVRARVTAIAEDDLVACESLASAHPGCLVAPAFDTPVDAKSYLADMDLLIGSRMHATIAAFTAGVAVVPVAYSRKFAGFYSNLGYDAVVDLLSLDEAVAAAMTLSLVDDRDRLRAMTVVGNQLAQEKIGVFIDQLAELFDARASLDA